MTTTGLKPIEVLALTPARLAAWRGPFVYCLRVYVIARAALFGLGLLAMGLVPTLAQGAVPGWKGPAPSPGWHNAVTAWERADALWYLRIASQGYRADDGSAAFFPLYPMLVRAVGYLTGRHWLLGAYLVSNLAMLAALLLLYRLTALEFGEARGRRVVVLACLFPTSFFLFAPYTESLFLALSVAAFYAARRSRWGLVAAMGALAALTRSPGVLLAPAVAVEAVLQYRSGARGARGLSLARGLAASAVVPLGTLLYLGYWGRYAGDWRRPLDVQKSGWGKHDSWPWLTLWHGLRLGDQFLGSYPGAYFTVDALAVLLLLAVAVWSTMRLRLSYAVYVWASLLFPMTLMWPGRPFLSLPRLFVVVFPLFWGIAAFERRWRVRDAVVAIGAGGLAVLGTFFVTAYPIF
ncbi:MAG: membrane protein [Mycobacteriales bacterium]